MLNSDNITYGNFEQKITEELESVLVTALTNKEEIINNIIDIKTVATWYKEAKEQPNKIPSIITNEAISRLLESLGPYLSTFLINKIKIELELHSNIKIKELEISLAVKPYVEYIKRINRVESNKVRVTFDLSLSGKVNGITINSDDIMGRRIDIESLVASLSVSIINVTVSTLYLPGALMLKPIVLCHKQLYKIENLSFKLARYS